MRTKSAFNQELLSRYNLWLVAQQYIYKTQQIYMRVLSNFCKFLGHQSIMEATHFDIRAFLAHESRRGIAFNTIHHELNVLRMFYDFLNLGGLVNYVPPRFVRLRPVVKRIHIVLSEEAVEKLVKASRSPRDTALIELLYGTGCRLAEINTMRLECIDFKAR